VYSDNCYDSSAASSEPRGKVLVWHPQDSATGVEVPLMDTIDYRLKNKADGSVLQQGSLTFVPTTS
jgi:hypothetical protein